MFAGLEEGKTNKTLVGGNKYVTGEKFKTMMRHALIEWEQFLQAYKNLEDQDKIFTKGMEILGLEKAFQFSSLEDIYKLNNREHAIMMMRQFFTYEPLSYAIFQLFNTFKYHFETLVKTFVDNRNLLLYLTKNSQHESQSNQSQLDKSLGHQGDKNEKYNDIDQKLVELFADNPATSTGVKNQAGKVLKYNNWEALVNIWEQHDEEKDLQSSSVKLLFFNNKKLGIHFGLPYKSRALIKLVAAARKFRYCGFCPKVPEKRFICLMEFPYEEFSDVIVEMQKKILELDNKALNTDLNITQNKFKVFEKPNYSELLNRMNKAMKFEKEPQINNTKRPRKKMTEKQYMEHILEIRKKIAPYCIKLEEHYAHKAEVLDKVYKEIVKPFFKKYED